MKRFNELFEELKWIPEYLSKRVYNLARISYEEKDLKQELDLKLWQSINEYFDLIKIGKKPRVNIRRYCHTACLNKKVDFIRMLLRKKYKNEQLSLDQDSIDIGKTDFTITLEVGDYDEDLTIKIDGTDILDVEKDDIKKMMFKDFVYGFSYEEISFNYNVSIYVVRNNIHKTRKKIKERFIEEQENFFDFRTLLYIEDGQEDENENTVMNGSLGSKRKVSNFSNVATSAVLQKHQKYIKRTERRK